MPSVWKRHLRAVTPMPALRKYSTPDRDAHKASIGGLRVALHASGVFYSSRFARGANRACCAAMVRGSWLYALHVSQRSFLTERRAKRICRASSAKVLCRRRAVYCADDMVPNSIWNAASRLAADAKVRDRLEQLAEQKEAERRMLALSRADWVIERITQQVMDPATLRR